MKKILSIVVLLLGIVLLVGCETKNEPTEEPLIESICKADPLSDQCYVPSYDLDFISSEKAEFLISETFEFEFLNQSPSNWLLYKNEEYSSNSAIAKVVEIEGNKVVQMYSDGQNAPMYPQGVAKPASFIFSTKFNLDTDRKGVMTGKLMVPETEHNEVSFGLYTGAVNTASVIIDKQMKLTVKIGGPFFYHSGTGDSGTYIDTNITLAKGEFYTFKFEWDASIDNIKVWLVSDSDTLLYDGQFHISNRYNALEDGMILVPNVVKVTMPKALDMAGYAYIDDVIVERKGA